MPVVAQISEPFNDFKKIVYFWLKPLTESTEQLPYQIKITLKINIDLHLKCACSINHNKLLTKTIAVPIWFSKGQASFKDLGFTNSIIGTSMRFYTGADYLESALPIVLNYTGVPELNSYSFFLPSHLLQYNNNDNGLSICFDISPLLVPDDNYTTSNVNLYLYTDKLININYYVSSV